MGRGHITAQKGICVVTQSKGQSACIFIIGGYKI